MERPGALERYGKNKGLRAGGDESAWSALHGASENLTDRKIVGENFRVQIFPRSMERAPPKPDFEARAEKIRTSKIARSDFWILENPDSGHVENRIPSFTQACSARILVFRFTVPGNTSRIVCPNFDALVGWYPLDLAQ